MNEKVYIELKNDTILKKQIKNNKISKNISKIFTK